MSTDKQETSIPDQRAELTKHAATKGYRLVGEYVDEGISGDATEKRVAFQRMVADSGKKHFDLILCWDQDRFGRFDPLEGGYWIKPIRDAGVQLETIAQGRIDWSDFASRLVWTVNQEAKHSYLRTLSRDVVRGMRSAVCAGVYPGHAPFGYRKKDKRLVLGPAEEVETIRDIFSMKITGMGHRTICAKLKNAGRSAPGCGVWTQGQVRYILARLAYTGATRFGVRKGGKYNSQSEPLIIEGTHDPIISRETFDAAKRSCKPSTVSYRHGRMGGPLAGLMRCGMCGSLMYREVRRKIYGYICGNYHRKGQCGFCRINEADAVRMVAEKIREFVGRDVKQLIRQIELKLKSGDNSHRIGELQKKLADLDRQVQRAAERILTVDDSLLATVKAKIREMQAARDSVLGELESLKQLEPLSATEIAAQLLGLPDAIQLSPPELARNAINEQIAKITVHFKPKAKAGRYRSFEFVGIDIVLR